MVNEVMTVSIQVAPSVQRREPNTGPLGISTFKRRAKQKEEVKE